MKYLRQFGIICTVTCVGEFLKYLIPLPVPAGIYGMVLMFGLLYFKVIQVEQVKETGEFLVEMMPLMFIPAAAGLITAWEQMKGMLLPLCVIIPLSTCLVMLVTGKIADVVIDKKRGQQNE